MDITYTTADNIEILEAGQAMGRSGIRVHGNQIPMMLRGRPRTDWMRR